MKPLTDLRGKSKIHFDLPDIDTLGQGNQGELRIGLLGWIGVHKGAFVLEELARVAFEQKLKVRFVVIGSTRQDHLIQRFGNVDIHGRYKEEDLPALLKASNLDFIFFSAVWPETYSYTLSHCLSAHIYPVSLDIGAVAERLKRLGLGSVLPYELVFDPEQLLKELCDLGSPGPLFVPHESGDYSSIFGDYYP